MTEITNEMWKKAIDHLKETEQKHKSFIDSNTPNKNWFHIQILKDRHHIGERSAELYNAIMGLR